MAGIKFAILTKVSVNKLTFQAAPVAWGCKRSSAHQPSLDVQALGWFAGDHSGGNSGCQVPQSTGCQKGPNGEIRKRPNNRNEVYWLEQDNMGQKVVDLNLGSA